MSHIFNIYVSPIIDSRQKLQHQDRGNRRKLLDRNVDVKRLDAQDICHHFKSVTLFPRNFDWDTTNHSNYTLIINGCSEFSRACFARL